jgi:cytochrome c-type biogenesis protein CcmH/NrfG
MWLNLGLSLRDLGSKGKAIAALRRALKLDPQIKDRFPAD